MDILEKMGDDIWIYNGSEVSFYGMPFTTRMTIIRLNKNDLWIHSPEKIINGLIDEIKQLGEVKYLVSPNKIHHLFTSEWVELFPDAKVYAAPGLKQKRKDITFDKELADNAEKEWRDDIEQLIFMGSWAMQEVVFFHKKSAVLILTDLIENFDANHFSGFKKSLAAITGIISPNGKTPIDWRASFFFGKNKARHCFKKMLSWQPNKIIVAHGHCINENAVSFLQKSFRWLGHI